MSFPIHPDDMPSPRFGGWADDFNTYEEACEYYGVDTPAQVAAENAYYDMLERDARMDEMEAAGPQYGAYVSTYAVQFDDDFPF